MALTNPMRYHPTKHAFRVTVDESDVQALAASWPCSNLRHGDRAWLLFDSQTGDLLAYQVTHSKAGWVDSGDCPSISALADTAKTYGFKRRFTH